MSTKNLLLAVAKVLSLSILIFNVGCDQARITQGSLINQGPKVYSVSPSEIPISQPAVLKIAGKNFSDNAIAAINGVTCLETEVLDSENVLCYLTSPKDILQAQSGFFSLSTVTYLLENGNFESEGLSGASVTNPDKQTGILLFPLNYRKAPEITEITPSKLSLFGGVQVHIKGVGLSDVVTVTIGNKNCANIQKSETEVLCISPEQHQGKYSVSLTDSSGQVSEGNFEVSYEPSLLMADSTLLEFPSTVIHSNELRFITLKNNGPTQAKEIKLEGLDNNFESSLENCAGGLEYLQECKIPVYFKPNAVIDESKLMELVVSYYSGVKVEKIKLAVKASSFSIPPVVAFSTSEGSLVNVQNEAKFLLEGTCSAEGQLVSIGGAISASTVCLLGKWSTLLDATNVAQGSFQLNLDSQDQYGTVAERVFRSFNKDTVAPTLNLLTPVEGSIYNNSSTAFIISGLCSEQGTVKISGALSDSLSCVSGQFSKTYPIADLVAEGILTLHAEMVDFAGNTGVQTTRNFTKDTIVPQFSLISPVSGLVLNGNSGSLNVSGVCSKDGTVILSGPISDLIHCVNGVFLKSYSLSQVAAEGNLTIVANYVDTNGNTGTQITRDIFKDTIAPLLTVVTPANNLVINFLNEKAIQASGECSEEGRDVIISLTHIVNVLTTSRCQNHSWNAVLDFSTFSYGVYSLRFSQSDSAGNFIDVLRSVTKSQMPLPEVLSVSPAQGLITGGTEIILSGRGLFSYLATKPVITINSIPCTLVSFDETNQSMHCLTGSSSSAGSYLVVVTNPDQRKNTSGPTFSYLNVAPTISSITPSVGTTLGGTVLTISGSNFISGSIVKLGDKECLNSQVTESQITCTTDSHFAGTVDVIVINPNQQTATLAGGFTYIPSEGVWSSVQTLGAPEARYYHTAVWAGSKMIVFGGRGAADFNTGGIYDPINDSWSVLPTLNAPSPRQEHTAVWTGSKMIVFGGVQLPFVWYNTGAKYDPASNEWEPIAQLGAPSPRFRHSAVWTGKEMLVYGGYGGGASNFNTGGLYDPELNIWKEISTIGAPYGTYNHSAVWSGSKFIVFGGAWANGGGGYGVVNFGASYDPKSNSWASLPLIGAPSARSQHTAIWTGSKMIVFGGYGEGGESLNSGAVFDPQLNAWASLALSKSPETTRGHSAIWTGSKMLVFGGYTSNVSSTNGGGIYDPRSSEWSEMSKINAPSFRGFHTSTWSGSKMIVFGGVGGVSGGALNSGGAYTYVSDTKNSPLISSITVENLTESTGNAQLIVKGQYIDAASTVQVGGVPCISLSFVNSTEVRCEINKETTVSGDVILTNSDGQSAFAEDGFKSDY